MSQLPAELRAECVRLRVEKRLTAPEIKAQTGVAISTLQKWLAKHRLTPAEIRAAKIRCLRKARKVRLEKNGYVGGEDWSAEHTAALRSLYPASPIGEVYAAIPGRTPHAISEKANQLGITRKVRAHTGPRRYVDPLYRDLRQRRIAQGLSQAALAAKIPTDETTLCAWENGRKEPLWPGLRQWVEALGLELRLEPKRAQREPWTGIAPLSRDQLMARRAA